MTWPPVHATHGGASFDAIGTDFRALERRRDVVSADVLDAWYDPAPSVVAVIAEHLTWLVRTSPPTHADGLERTIAEVRGIDPAGLLAGGGSSNLVYLLLPHLVRPGDRTGILEPTYGEYAHVLESVMGLRASRCTQRPEDGFRASMDELLEHASRCDVLVLVNPNSPTGTYLTREAVREVLAALPRFAWLVVDETYADFVPESASLEREAAQGSNLVVVKSMSKWYALSGCRAGYLCGPPALVRTLRRHTPPWPVGLLGQVAAVEALRSESWYRDRTRETHELRASLAAELRRIPGLRTYPSVANFLLLELTGDGARASDVVAGAARLGVFLRDCDDLGRGLEGRFLRVAVKDAASNARIVGALRESLPVRHVPRPGLGPELPDVASEIPRTAPVVPVPPAPADAPDAQPLRGEAS